MDEKYDIVGLGVAAVDNIVVVDKIPMSNTKQHFIHHEKNCGGLTATALVAASRLGCKCYFASYLGENETSDFVRSVFKKENIDYENDIKYPDSSPVYSIILVENETGDRTILCNTSINHIPDIEEYHLDIIKNSSCLFVDQVFAGKKILAAKFARENNIDVVGDFENFRYEGVRELITYANHLILPRYFACELTGLQQPEEILKFLMSTGNHDVACVTDGANGCWYTDKYLSENIFYQPAFKVNVVDTTGCGDVFHGAYAAALSKGMPLKERFSFATATASLKARHRGGQKGIPSLLEVINFLKNL